MVVALPRAAHERPTPDIAVGDPEPEAIDVECLGGVNIGHAEDHMADPYRPRSVIGLAHPINSFAAACRVDR